MYIPFFDSGNFGTVESVGGKAEFESSLSLLFPIGVNVLVKEGLFRTAALGLEAAASAMDSVVVDSGAEGDVVDAAK